MRSHPAPKSPPAAGLNATADQPRMLALPFDGATDARTLSRAVAPLQARFGFGSLSYFVTTRRSGVVNGEMVWTTLPRAWSACYRREAYIALDPRVAPTRRHLAPFLWEACMHDADWRMRPFLADARGQGIAGGVVISLHDSPTHWVTVSFDSNAEPVHGVVRDQMASRVGDYLLIAIALHGCIVQWPRAQMRRKRLYRSLTFRERDCLSLAARGLNSADIGERLSVAERTVNFHFRNIKSKLGAINRPEAIARGISLGILTADGE